MRDVRLTRALVLETPADVSDGAGGLRKEWDAQGVLWADMRPRSAGPGPGEELNLSRAGWRVIVRATPPGAPSRPEAGHRFREGERIFRIMSVAEDGPLAKWLICQAEEERVR